MLRKVHTTVVLSDIHWDIRHVKAVKAVTKFLEETKPEVIVLLGDIYDAHMLSTYPKSKRKTYVDLGDEVKSSAKWLNHLCEIAGRVIFTTGNHEDRLKRMEGREPGVPSELLTWPNIFEKLGVSPKLEIFNTKKSKDGILRIGKVAMIHGHNYGQYQSFSNITKEYTGEHCIVQGHSHRPSVHWWKGKCGVVNGHLSDKSKSGYLPNPQWTMGITLVEHFSNMTKYNVHPITIDEDGRFSYAGKCY